MSVIVKQVVETLFINEPLKPGEYTATVTVKNNQTGAEAVINASDWNGDSVDYPKSEYTLVPTSKKQLQQASKPAEPVPHKEPKELVSMTAKDLAEYAGKLTPPIYFEKSDDKTSMVNKIVAQIGG